MDGMESGGTCFRGCHIAKGFDSRHSLDSPVFLYLRAGGDHNQIEGEDYGMVNQWAFQRLDLALLMCDDTHVAHGSNFRIPLHVRLEGELRLGSWSNTVKSMLYISTYRASAGYSHKRGNNLDEWSPRLHSAAMTLQEL